LNRDGGSAVPKIPLSRGKFALVDYDDWENIAAYRWHTNASGYAVRSGDRVYMHREILRAGAGEMVDHINHDKLDNRRANLRFVSEHQSHGNMRPQKRGRSRFKGVFAVSGAKGRAGSRPWRAQINQNGKSVYLGVFGTEEDAALAYNEAARAYFGECAWLNPVGP
jgi:hypothetical protein